VLSEHEAYMESAATLRARIGGACRRGNTDLADEARRDLRYVTIKELVESAPPLTEEQAERIAYLLGFRGPRNVESG
jgi:hypothetical protein